MAAALHKLLNEMLGNVSGRKLADSLGKSPSYVSQMRSGAQIPTPETLAALANAFGVVSRLPELLVAALHDQVEQLPPADPLRQSLLDAIAHLTLSLGPSTTPALRTSGRTFLDFPNSFYPLAVVTGDKREDRENNITVGDLGVYAATPGDTRWLLNLGLRPDVIKHIDKNFVLLSEDELIREFAEVNLLIVGSPASNHLARRINSSAVFRFNYSPAVENAINEIITKAVGLSTAELVAYRERERNGLVALNRLLFAGGIFDPTHPGEDYVAATYAQLPVRTQLDFGILTFAANPYYVLKCRHEGRVCDHKYVSIMAAGIHHPATAHALRLLGQDCRQEGVFDKHPYGGVIRVELDLSVPFSTRTIKASYRWEDVADKARKPSDDQKKLLLDQLEIIEKKLGKRELKGLALDEKQAVDCRRLIESL